MRGTDFNEMYVARVAKSNKVLPAKGEEYSSNDDRLHNFKRVAEIARVSPARAAIVLMAKHIVSVIDKVEDGTEITQEWIDEKVGDWYNYIVLLEGLLVEEMERQKTCT